MIKQKNTNFTIINLKHSNLQKYLTYNINNLTNQNHTQHNNLISLYTQIYSPHIQLKFLTLILTTTQPKNTTNSTQQISYTTFHNISNLFIFTPFSTLLTNTLTQFRIMNPKKYSHSSLRFFHFIHLHQILQITNETISHETQKYS